MRTFWFLIYCLSYSKSGKRHNCQQTFNSTTIYILVIFFYFSHIKKITPLNILLNILSKTWFCGMVSLMVAHPSIRENQSFIINTQTQRFLPHYSITVDVQDLNEYSVEAGVFMLYTLKVNNDSITENLCSIFLVTIVCKCMSLFLVSVFQYIFVLSS